MNVSLARLAWKIGIILVVGFAKNWMKYGRIGLDSLVCFCAFFTGVLLLVFRE
jgi:uncharacterized membrane protein (DUF485 family)